MGSNLIDFVNEEKSKINSFDSGNLECIKRIIRKAIDTYHLKSYEEVEETDIGSIRFLYIHSIVEENLLSKIVEELRNSQEDLNIEGVYEGYVIRTY
ncbi:DUF6407 family protein [Litchfieldia salsa]|uniref:Uncharacterized protein n=1 Tax=Litchfieldia salsa TaxID=930152 RepID=A0A1H0RQH7_9BACI|nr:DUF6407 family protein [Litchfieldia salsa]SDP31707.1 hypothetical protein SAMN05216565_102336 [Litchfieldia salsa]